MNDYKELIADLREFSYVLTNSQKAADTIEQLVRERDAAIEDIAKTCNYCSNNNLTLCGAEPCAYCDQTDACNARLKKCEGCELGSNWEWRGVQE